MYPILSVNSTHALALEPLGTKRKFWYREADTGTRFLFKAEERGTGEDWAEKAACEIAALLGLPHVCYELAHDDAQDLPGVLCESFVRKPAVLVLGNQLMMERDSEYPADGGNRYKVREHTVADVAAVLANLKPPLTASEHPERVLTALDFFIGYVLLDALIANQDRHHENWGAVRGGGSSSLAPTFDHGASMARNLSDEERYERLSSRDKNRQLPVFVRRASSAFYADRTERKPLKTVEAWTKFRELAPEAGDAWLGKLDSLEESEIARILDEVPRSRMTQVCRDFTLELLSENRRRLLDTDA